MRLPAEDAYEESDSLEEPSREELQCLKEALKIEKGALAYKSGSVYQIRYENKKHVWNRLGSWLELKQQLEAMPTS